MVNPFQFFLKVMSDSLWWSTPPPTFCYGFLSPSFGHGLFLNQILDHQHRFFLDNTGKVGTENGISFRRGYTVLNFGHGFFLGGKKLHCVQSGGRQGLFKGTGFTSSTFITFMKFCASVPANQKSAFGCKTWRNCRLRCGEPGAALHLVHLLSHRRNRFPVFFWWCQFLWVTHRLTVFKPEN